MHVPRLSRVVLTLMVLASTLITLSAAWLMVRFASSVPTAPAFSSSALIAHLQECADLVTVRAPITTVIEHYEEGRFGSATALLAITAWLDVGCDLQQASVSSSDNSARIIHLTLPAPRVLAVRLDAQKTHVYDLRRGGLWRFIPGTQIERDLVNRAVQSATTSTVIDQPATDALVHLARERIRAQIQRLVSGTGWSIEVDWQE